MMDMEWVLIQLFVLENSCSGRRIQIHLDDTWEYSKCPRKIISRWGTSHQVSCSPSSMAACVGMAGVCRIFCLCPCLSNQIYWTPHYFPLPQLQRDSIWNLSLLSVLHCTLRREKLAPVITCHFGLGKASQHEWTWWDPPKSLRFEFAREFCWCKLKRQYPHLGLTNFVKVLNIMYFLATLAKYQADPFNL